jgi:hypothetical protein
MRLSVAFGWRLRKRVTAAAAAVVLSLPDGRTGNLLLPDRLSEAGAADCDSR